jgi:3-oxoacyl-[acyl-carrier-protein] synthase III
MTRSYTQDIRTVGISSFGYYIPSGILTSEEIAKASGIPLRRSASGGEHIAGVDEHPADMGVKAAESAIKTAGISPEEIGIVAYCGAGFYEYQFWSPAAKVQAAIGAPEA